MARMHADELEIDDALVRGLLAGARGWALSQAVAYYTPENNPVFYHQAEKWLELVLSERREGT